MLRTLPVLLLLLLVLALDMAAPVGAQEGRKIALIVNVSSFGTPPKHPVTGEQLPGYRYLPTVNDGEIMRAALEAHGFTDDGILMLQDSSASAADIQRGFDWLRREADEDGGVVVFYFAGHGHRMPNNNPESDPEEDGLDEILVPFGAPSEFWDGYDGELHLRDDELGELLAELRGRVGPRGSVAFFIDACFSGSGTRGTGVVRGYGSPVAGSSESGTGIDATATRAGAGTRSRGDGLAPYAVMSAASQHQLAFGVEIEKYQAPVGTFTYALAKALHESGPGTTHAALHARVTRTVNGLKPQDPQLEGTENAELFGGRLLVQAPYVAVDRVAENGLVTLAGGQVVGLNAGARLLVHPIGATQPDARTALATLEVTEAGSIRSEAEVVDGSLRPGDRGAWAFITERSFGARALRVSITEGVPDFHRQKVDSLARAFGIVEMVEGDQADLFVEADDGRLQIRLVDPLGAVLERGPQEVLPRIEAHARNRYLRGLDFDDPNMDVTVELAPVEWDPDRPTPWDRRERGYCGEPDWDAARQSPKNLGGGQWSFGPGEYYAMRVTNTGTWGTHVAVLSLAANDTTYVLYPDRDVAAGSDAVELKAGDSTVLPCIVTDTIPGHDMIKVFATSEPQPFRRMLGIQEVTRSRGLQTALSPILDSSFEPVVTRGPPGLATTRSVQVWVR